MLNDAFDSAILPSGIPTFKNCEDLFIAPNEMPLQLNQLDLELAQVVLVGLFRNRRLGSARFRSIGFLRVFQSYSPKKNGSGNLIKIRVQPIIFTLKIQVVPCVIEHSALLGKKNAARNRSVLDFNYIRATRDAARHSNCSHWVLLIQRFTIQAQPHHHHQQQE